MKNISASLNTKRQLYIMVLLISLSLIILGGTSYALIQRALTGTNTYSLQTGNFLVEFNKTDVITLSNQVPVYDNVGLNSENEFSFTVTNTGNYSASYSIKIEDNSTDSIGDVIRYAVNYGDGYSYQNVHALVNNAYVIQNKSLSVGQSDNYNVKFWLDIDATEVYINQQFNGRIVIEATQEEYKYGPNVLDAVYNLEDKEGLEAVDNNGSLYTSGNIREYRYTGASPSNYVWFNCTNGYTSGEDYCEKWRIIGSFVNTYENGVGEYRVLKIVRDTALTTTYPYNSNSGNIANFEGSSIQTYLNGTYYNSLTTNTKNLIMKANFSIGATINTNTAISSYNTETSLKDYNYVGLINASDFGYGGNSNLWATSLNTTSFTSSNNWLYQENSMVLNTLSLTGTNMYYLSSSGLVSGTTSTSYNVRPVVYLKPDVSIIGGYGTSSEPYELAIKFAMTYGTKTKIKTQKVTYNVNGGVGTMPVTYIGEALASEVPTREGYIFKGWSTNQNATEAEYQSGDEYDGSSVTLYAVWKVPTLYDTVEISLASYLLTDDGDARILSGGGGYNDGNPIEDANFKNYVWYSGKLWRIVSLNNDGSIKLVTQDQITTIAWGTNTTYSGSWMYQWLNEDFKDTLYNYENLLVTNYKWNATETTANTKPANTTMVEGTVGLLNYYEYVQSYSKASSSTGYLNNGYYWWLMTPDSSSNVRYVNYSGTSSNANFSDPASDLNGARPSVNLKSNIQIGGGEGTKTNPYTIVGDISEPAENELISERVSGEYLTFDNQLYRIVSIENNITKITKVDYIRDSSNTVVKKYLSSTYLYGASGNTQSDDYWDYYLNNTWYNSISTNYKNMIVSGTWYLGTVGDSNSYKNAICATSNTTVSTKNCTRTSTVYNGYVGLGRIGEMFTSQIGEGQSTSSYIWTITPYTSSYVRALLEIGYASYSRPASYRVGARPSVNLKSTIKITGGLGTKESPFELGE